MLDPAAQEHWQRHGWLWLRGFLGDEAARDLGVWTDEIAAWPEVPGRWMRYYDRLYWPPERPLDEHAVDADVSAAATGDNPIATL